jgi:hypothetical protein
MKIICLARFSNFQCLVIVEFVFIKINLIFTNVLKT